MPISQLHTLPLDGVFVLLYCIQLRYPLVGLSLCYSLLNPFIFYIF